MSEHDTYSNPLVTRYASREMAGIFSARRRAGTWRRLWTALADEERKLGLPISDEQVREMEAHLDDIDFDNIARHEKNLRHDVMAHVKSFGEVAPKSAGIMHLGATSCFITDNADLILHREALELLREKICAVLMRLRTFCRAYQQTPCLGWTHFQPAQLTTVGKRATLWAQDLLMDLADLEAYIKTLPFRGAKGTTGTQASFMELFDGDFEKVKKLDVALAQRFGFSKPIAVSGQTYTRKWDEKLMSLLSGIAGSGAKFANDMRLLMHLRELEEPFERDQIGSSAMAYKRNPMRSERMCSLARLVQSQVSVLSGTVATQWLERTLDDSACRRLAIPEAFLGADAILRLYHNIAEGIVVYPVRIARRVEQELPFMATEKIIMECVRAGGDRQQVHEAIRGCAMQVRRELDEGGESNRLVELLQQDKVFANIADRMPDWMDARRFVGAAPQQVDDFIRDHLDPALLASGLDLNKVNIEGPSV